MVFTEPWSKWYGVLKFAETWYFLNLTSFSKVRASEWVFADSDGHFQRHPSKKHQESEDAVRNLRWAFTDMHENYHTPVRPERDDSLPILGPVVCARCGRGPTTMVELGEEDAKPRKLERDHILALHLGGLDVSENLQWLCYVCHKFKSAEEDILAKLSGMTVAWRRRMWEHRLRVLRERNPPGKEHYSWYIDDPSTAYDVFYKTRERKRTVLQPSASANQAVLV